MLVKGSELQGAPLDWAVATLEGCGDWWLRNALDEGNPFFRCIHSYSSLWSLGGPIIERVELCAPSRFYGCAAGNPNKWQAGMGIYPYMRAATPLVASMRSYVTRHLANEDGEIEVPDVLMRAESPA